MCMCGYVWVCVGVCVCGMVSVYVCACVHVVHVGCVECVDVYVCMWVYVCFLHAHLCVCTRVHARALCTCV